MSDSNTNINEREAHEVFARQAWRNLREKIYNIEGLAISNIVWIEGCPGCVCHQLDTVAGVDALLTTWRGQEGVYGLAFRSQLHGVEAPYKGTFTIRRTVTSNLKTEIDKRLASLTNGSLAPQYMCHMYWRNVGGWDRVSEHRYKPEYGAIAKTADVLQALLEAKNPPIGKAPDGNAFFIVPFNTVPNIHWHDWSTPQEPAHAQL